MIAYGSYELELDLINMFVVYLKRLQIFVYHSEEKFSIEYVERFLKRTAHFNR